MDIVRKENWKLINLEYAPLVIAFTEKVILSSVFLDAVSYVKSIECPGKKDMEKKLMTTNHIVHK